MLEPVQQAGQWVLKKAQSLPQARVDQSDFAPNNGQSSSAADTPPLGLAGAGQNTGLDRFERQVFPDQSTQEKGLVKIPTSPLRQLQNSLKTKLSQSELWHALTEKNPFRNGANIKPHAPSPPAKPTEEGLLSRTARTLHLKKAPPQKISPYLPREAALRGFPKAYRNLSTVPHISISPQEIAFSVQEAKANQEAHLVLDVPWNTDSLFCPFSL